MAWAPDYATASELRAYVTRSSATVDDTELGFALTAASRAVDQYCGRQFGQVSPAAARVYTPEWDRRRGRWIIDVDDISATTNLAVAVADEDDEVFDEAITDYRLWPFNADENGRPWTRIIVQSSSTVAPVALEGSVQVTAMWGWSAVPTAVKNATLIMANRIFMRRTSPYGIAGSPETGSELRLLRQVDVDAQTILAPYRRLWAAE